MPQVTSSRETTVEQAFRSGGRVRHPEFCLKTVRLEEFLGFLFINSDPAARPLALVQLFDHGVYRTRNFGIASSHIAPGRD